MADGVNDKIMTATTFQADQVTDVIISSLAPLGIKLTADNIGTDFTVMVVREGKGDFNLAGTLRQSGPYPDAQLLHFHAILAGIAGSRVIRSAVLTVRSHQYIDAARAIGAHDVRIMLRHVVPNIVPSLIVLATIGLGATILAESALSFVGLGVQENSQPTWGYMLNLGRQVASQYPWQAIWPGLAIAIAVYSVDMLGDALRDLLDPRLRGAGTNFS